LYYIFPNTTILNNAGVWQSFPGLTPGEATLLFNFSTIGDNDSMSEAQHQRFQFALSVHAKLV
jgi:hypothetical protein